MILLVEKMHRTAEPARAAGFFAEKFGHTGIGAGAAGPGMAVIPISGYDVIVIAHDRHPAHRLLFLADVKVTKSTDLLRLILLARSLFETADRQHQREHLDLVAWLGPLHWIVRRGEAGPLPRGQARACGQGSCTGRKAP